MSGRQWPTLTKNSILEREREREVRLSLSLPPPFPPPPLSVCVIWLFLKLCYVLDGLAGMVGWCLMLILTVCMIFCCFLFFLRIYYCAAALCEDLSEFTLYMFSLLSLLLLSTEGILDFPFLHAQRKEQYWYSVAKYTIQQPTEHLVNRHGNTHTVPKEILSPG